MSSALLALVLLARPELDAPLSALLEDALKARPELRRAQAEVEAAEARVPQAAAFPDPMLSFAVQNDGFTRWQVGTMGTSWVGFMAAQTIPFPGKTALRAEVASTEVTARKVELERARLQLGGDVARAWLAVQLAREQLALVARLEALVTAAQAAALARVENGEGSQADMLRAGLEATRLAQRRTLLSAEVTQQLLELNRLCGRPPDAPVADAPSLVSLGFPRPSALDVSQARYLEQNPELVAVAVLRQRSVAQRALAARSVAPDFTVGASLMLRGALEPMWQLSVGVPIPVFAGGKQLRAVSESEASLRSSTEAQDALKQVVQTRLRQRDTRWRALETVFTASRTRLEPEADAVVEVTLAQYRVGKLPLTSVLEAAVAAVAVREATLDTLSAGWRLAVADEEFSLDDVAALSVSTAGPPTGGM